MCRYQMSTRHWWCRWLQWRGESDTSRPRSRLRSSTHRCSRSPRCTPHSGCCRMLWHRHGCSRHRRCTLRICWWWWCHKRHVHRNRHLMCSLGLVRRRGGHLRDVHRQDGHRQDGRRRDGHHRDGRRHLLVPCDDLEKQQHDMSETLLFLRGLFHPTLNF